jgi:hypothetical protein
MQGNSSTVCNSPKLEIIQMPIISKMAKYIVPHSYQLCKCYEARGLNDP